MNNLINKVMVWAKSVSIINWIKIALVVIILIVGGIYLSQKKDNGTTNTNGTNNTNTSVSTTTKNTTSTTKVVAKYNSSKCNFIITSPTINSSISFPFTVKGTIDKLATNKGCIWNEDKSRAGNAELFYNLRNEGWKSSGTAVPIITGSTPGAATTTVSFSAQFNLYTAALGITPGTPIKITFTELNVLDQKNPDTFDLLLYSK